MVLQNELLGSVSPAPSAHPTQPLPGFLVYLFPNNPDPNSQNKTPPSSPTRLFSYSRKVQPLDDSLYSLSPLGLRSQALLSSPKKAPRKIPKALKLVIRCSFHQVPFKVLEAPSIQDDFYLNLVDWSCNNMLAVGLQNSVYLWSAAAGSVCKPAYLPL